jgi:hypothetical protein
MNIDEKNKLINDIIKETTFNKEGMQNYIMSLYDVNQIYPKPLLNQYKEITNIIDIYIDRLIKHIDKQKNIQTILVPYEIIQPSAPDIQYIEYVPQPKYNTLPLATPTDIKYETRVLYNTNTQNDDSLCPNNSIVNNKTCNIL